MKQKVTKIINDWDPIDLFPYSPKDEYEVEINLIVNLIEQLPDVQSLADGIKNIFTRRFGGDVFTKDIEECIQIANKIYEECSIQL